MGSRLTSGTRILQIKRSDESVWQEYNAVNNTDFNTGGLFTFTGKTEMTFDIRVKSGSVMAYINVIDINITTSSSGNRINENLEENSNNRSNDVLEQNSGIEIYPNPTDQRIYLMVENPYKGRTEISVTDQFGRMVKHFQVNKPFEILHYETNLSGLPNGIYFLQIKMGAKTENIRLIKL